jgi:hypothetical protein
LNKTLPDTLGAQTNSPRHVVDHYDGSHASAESRSCFLEGERSSTGHKMFFRSGLKSFAQELLSDEKAKEGSNFMLPEQIRGLLHKNWQVVISLIYKEAVQIYQQTKVSQYDSCN